MNASNCRLGLSCFYAKQNGSRMIEVPHNALSCHIEFCKTKLEEMASQKPHVLQEVTMETHQQLAVFVVKGSHLFSGIKMATSLQCFTACIVRSYAGTE